MSTRVLCVDPKGRVLMLASGATVWSAPGGEPNVGESAHAAACRALWQQVGLAVDELGAALAVVEAGTWFAVRLPEFEPVPASGLPVQSCWLHPDELDSVGGTHRVEPAETSSVAREAHELLALTVAQPGILGTWWIDRAGQP